MAIQPMVKAAEMDRHFLVIIRHSSRRDEMRRSVTTRVYKRE